MRVEALNENSILESIPVSGDSTRHAVKWKTGDLAFWVSASPDGASNGYVAAGGPGFTSHLDTTGA